jgi:DNA-binding SARP family transcriptional activator/DNA-binding CsgD family transcriptional regulator
VTNIVQATATDRRASMEDLLEVLARSARAMAVILLADMTILALNDRAVQLFGGDMTSWVGRQASHLFHGADEIYATIGLGALASGALDCYNARRCVKAAANAEVWISVRTLKLKDGEVVAVEVATPVDQPHPRDGVEEELSSFPSVDWEPAIPSAPRRSGGADLQGSAYATLDGLPDRQREVVTALMQGARVHAIAAALYVSTSTVRSHLSAIFAAFGVHSQTELLIRLRSQPEDVGRADRKRTPSGRGRERTLGRGGAQGRLPAANFVIDPMAAAALLTATRALHRVDAVPDAVAVCVELVRELGGWTTPARLDDGRAIPLDCSFGDGEPLLPVADSPLARLRLERVLPEFLDDARDVIALVTARALRADAERKLVSLGLGSFETLGEHTADRALNKLLHTEPVIVERAATNDHLVGVGRRLLVIGGPMSVADRDGIHHIPAGNAQRLVGVVAARGGVASIDVLAGAMWPNDDLAISRTRLRNVLMRLRRGAGSVVTRTGTSIRLAPDVTCDLHEFVRRASESQSATRSDPDVGGRLAAKAVKLVNGEVFADFEYEEWAQAARRQVAQMTLGLLDLLSVQAEDAGDLATAQHLAERALRLDCYTDSHYTRLAQLLTLQGRNAAAATVLEDAAIAARERSPIVGSRRRQPLRWPSGASGRVRR